MSIVIQRCETPGCSVTIRAPIGQQAQDGLCKWCAAGTAYNTRDPFARRHVTGPHLSLDEFGQDLFGAIKAQSGSLQAFKRAALYRAKGLTGESEVAVKAGMECQHGLEAIFAHNTIAVADVRRILAMQ